MRSTASHLKTVALPTLLGSMGPLAMIVLVAACASRTYAPTSLSDVDLTTRAVSQESRGVRVRAAVPSPEESQAIFGLPVYDRGIQPIWLEITNHLDERIRFAPVGTDREYYSPYEVAYMHKSKYAGEAYEAMERAVAGSAMPRVIWPGQTRSGFVFTHAEPGTKAFNVDVFTLGTELPTFSFFLEVPGFEPDHAAIDFQTLYDEADIARVDLDGLRTALGEIGCCTTDAEGQAAGLPLNLALVGPGRDVLNALLRADFVERGRAERGVDAETELYWQGRPADAVFRTSRRGGRERNELRVWRAPIEVDGEPVWMAQITNYLGRPTQLGRALFDPRLDPNLDDATVYTLQRMWYAQSLSAYAWQQAGSASTIDAPIEDFRGVAYFTGGARIVLWLSGDPISQTETIEHEWDDAPYRVQP